MKLCTATDTQQALTPPRRRRAPPQLRFPGWEGPPWDSFAPSGEVISIPALRELFLPAKKDKPSPAASPAALTPGGTAQGVMGKGVP